MTLITFLQLLTLLLLPTSLSSSHRILHQPFFPVTDYSPPPPSTTAQPPSTTVQPPSISPSPQPKYPFSSQPPPTLPPPPPPPPPHHHTFFPFSTTPSPPTTTTTVPSTSLPTFPANISSIIIPPPSPSSSKSHLSKKLLFLSLSLSLVSIAFIAAVAASLLYHRNHNHNKQPPSSDSLRLFPANLPTSDKPPPPTPPPTLPDNFSTPSSEFLYLGTLISPINDKKETNNATSTTMDSPELHPLPPLPRHGFRHHHHDGGSSTDDTDLDDNEFFSPKQFPVVFEASPPNNFHGRSSNSTPAAVKLPPPPPPPPMPPPGFLETHFSVQESTFHGRLPAPAPEFQIPAEDEERKNEILKPKLKALHWDKVRANSEKATVWDQLKSSTFKLNEEMIETLFIASSSKVPGNNGGNEAMGGGADMKRVLDPHKSRNIAILLRAFNLTIDEVSECILQGNVDTLGSELLGSLLKMAPTIEEEDKLKDASSFNLSPAEKFLKAVIDIPFAFKRVDAMLYISNFDVEIDYLKRSFETIESACQQLRNSQMFMKLLEAALKAGNRMNIGTNRGDAYAFKLDTLLKLVDVKGTDGKTTLLHFVVQEIIRIEGCRLSGVNHDLTTNVNHQSELRDEIEFRKRGLEVVSSLGGELSSIKKAAAMDSDLLSKEVTRLAIGITKIREVITLDENFGSDRRFSDSMKMFLKKAEDDIIKIEAKEKLSISMVKETTEYFHGNSSMEEAQPLRIFMVVRDFLTVLDQVCKEVGKINERTTVGMPMSQTLPSVFPWFNGRQHLGSPDDEDNPTLG